jgi:hypothetical protein
VQCARSRDLSSLPFFASRPRRKLSRIRDCDRSRGPSACRRTVAAGTFPARWTRAVADSLRRASLSTIPSPDSSRRKRSIPRSSVGYCNCKRPPCSRRPNYPHKLTNRRSVGPAAEPPRAARNCMASRRLQFAPAASAVVAGGWRAAVRSAPSRAARLRRSMLGGKNSQRCRQFSLAGCESAICMIIAVRHPRKWPLNAPSPSVARQQAVVHET